MPGSTSEVMRHLLNQRQPIAEVSEDEGNNELPLHASSPCVPGVSEKL